jgi:hypothetical protein
MVNDDWNIVVLAAFSFPVLIVIVVLMPSAVSAMLRKLRR